MEKAVLVFNWLPDVQMGVQYKYIDIMEAATAVRSDMLLVELVWYDNLQLTWICEDMDNVPIQCAVGLQTYIKTPMTS